MKRAPILSENLDDIQGMLKSGYGWLRITRFRLLTIRDGYEEQARAWLSRLVNSGLMVSAEGVAKASKKERFIDEAVAIAFSFSGLAKLGCKETVAHPFPTPFSSGMGSKLREGVLKDTPRQWDWSDVEAFPGRQTVHVLVAHWKSSDKPLQTPDPAEPDPAAFIVTTIENNPDAFGKDGKLYEPFRFRDGLAQPVIYGLRNDDGDGARQARLDAGPLYQDRVVAPGEFILGYRNEYDELTYCPDVEDWRESGHATQPGGRFTLNGSYLAVRQIEQNMTAFKALEAAVGQSICEKLMGRSKDGKPLLWKGDPNAVVSDSTADAFRFQVEDANGFMCPKGSHVRRMNPRDSLGIDVESGIKASKLHRLLRRGRPYLQSAKNANEEPSQGIFFIACNADFERQFEFIHQRWLRNFRFGSLHDEDDPLVGSPGPKKTFTVPGLPTGHKYSLHDYSLQDLTRTLGGGYFFLPGIKAIKFIVNPAARPARNGPDLAAGTAAAQ